MLQKITSIKGSKQIDRIAQKKINGGFGGNCPQLGHACRPNTPVTCIPIEPLVCCKGVWVRPADSECKF